MRDLVSQEMFEELWTQNPIPGPECFEGCRDADNSWIVYFTAAWCGPCKRLDCDELDKVAALKNLTIWKCDAVVNDYTAGYCGVKAFPTFMHFQPKKIVSVIQSNQTEAVKQWLLQQ